MADQFSTLIDFVNQASDGQAFTSKQLKAVTEGIGNPKSVNSFINTSFRMGIFKKEPIENPGKRQCRINYVKVRSFTNNETKKLTTYPDCIDFKKDIDAAYLKKVGQATKAPKKKDGVVNVSAHTRKKPSNQKMTISEHDTKTVITIFK
jgi:hypothetical protein